MRIQHNIAAMNSYRNFSANTSSLNKNLEKLSTGYKIHRAGDDAAGLAISEKMRAQISGLEGATKNAKDGISLVQTAEGALTEVHDMLNRMTTLAEQSANGTYDNDVDRAPLQKEIEQLQDEIDRIADSTNFNGLKLLNGDLDSTTTTTDTTQFTKIDTKLLATNNTNSADGVVGAGTILHQESGTAASKAQFSIELNDYAPAFDMNRASGDTLNTVSITIGGGEGTGAGQTNKTLSVTADEVAAQEGSSTTERIAKAFVAKYGENGTENQTEENGGSAGGVDNSGIDIYGANGGVEHFIVELGDDNSLKLTQKDPSTDATKLVNTELQIQVASTNYGDVEATTGTTNTLGITAGAFKFAENASNDDKAALRALLAGADKTIKITGTFDDDDDGTDEANEAEVGVGTDKLTFDLPDLGEDYTYKYLVDGQNTETEISNGGNVAYGGAAAADTLAADTGKLTLKVYNGASEVGSVALDLSSIVSKSSDAHLLNGKNTTVTLGLSDGADNSVKNYNASATIITEPKVASENQLASTYLKSTDLRDKIKDGAVMKIGDETYTFALGDESKVDVANTKNVVDLRDLTVDAKGQIALSDVDANKYDQLNKAMTRLTKAAEGNGMWSVGYQKEGKVWDDGAGDWSATADQDTDGVTIGHLTFTENKEYTGSADLTTRKGIADTILFASKATSETTEATGKALTLQIGDTADSYNKLSVNITDMHSASLGIGKDDINIGSQDGAATALDKIKKAVNLVSDVRGNLGALQNRLDHTINNLGVMRENIQNAESNIRDTDVAEEMMTYTKNSILNQSAQAMLAQANQLPQGVLQLLG